MPAGNEEDGGPAFPVLERMTNMLDEHTAKFITTGGMSLRDYFAGQALQSIVRNVGSSMNNPDVQEATPDSMSAAAYVFADAMLKARQGGE